MITQKCSKCEEEKKLTEEFWYRNRKSKSGFKNICKKCSAIDKKEYGKSEAGQKSLKKRIQKVKQKKSLSIRYQLLNVVFGKCQTRAKKNNLEFTITKNFISQMLDDQGFCCAKSGKVFKPIIKNEKYNKNPDGISIDRIDSTKGYIPDNVRLVTWFINESKNEYSDELFDSYISDIFYHQHPELKLL